MNFMLIQRMQIFLHFLVIIIFLQFTTTLNTYSQPISLNTKKEFITLHKRLFEDTINKRTDIDYPFVIGRSHNLITDNFNHPYFKDNKWTNGSIVYKGRTYTVRGIKYDIESDKLIYLMYTHDYIMNSIALDENFISEFKIFGSSFRHFDGLMNSNDRRIKGGYYEVVYDGKLKFLVRWEKTKLLDSNSSSMKYEASADMFLLKDGKMIGIRNMASLIRQLKDKKGDIKKLVRNNYLKLSESDFSSAYKVLFFYENPEK